MKPGLLFYKLNSFNLRKRSRDLARGLLPRRHSIMNVVLVAIEGLPALSFHVRDGREDTT